MDFFASARRPASLRMQRCNSVSYSNDVTDNVEPTTPLSCDGVTLLSLPSFHSTHRPPMVAGSSVPIPGNSRRRTGEQMSTSLLGRNESWSSFSSLHSLPEPFLYRNHNDSGSRGLPDPFREIPRASLGIPDVNGWHGSRGDVGHRTMPLLVNGYASAEPRMQHVFQQPSNGPTSCSSGRSNDSGTLRASSVGREIDSIDFENDENQPNSATKTPSLSYSDKTKNIRSSFARPTNAVVSQLMRAKSVTSKTLRKFGPKFSGSAKLIEDAGSADAKKVTVRRSASLAQRFRAFRQQSVESHLGVGMGDGKSGSRSLHRTRERSPLANETSVGHVTKSSNRADVPKSTPTAGRDPPRRVLFGTRALKDREASKKRLSFHGRDRTAISGDEMTAGSDLVRPRSTEPQSRSVRIEPSSYQIHASSPIMIETRRSATDKSFLPLSIGSVYSPGQADHTVPATRSPRIASPESSSLSSGSRSSVFSAARLSESFRQSNTALPSSPMLETAPSMSDLSLWEMPKLDIDLVDQMFVVQGRGTEPDAVPVLQISEPSPSVRLSKYEIGDSSMSSQHDPGSTTTSASTHRGSIEPCPLDCDISDSTASKTQEQTSNGNSDVTFPVLEPSESSASPCAAGLLENVGKS